MIIIRFDPKTILTWDTVDKLQGRPQSVELCALVDIQDSVGWRFSVPYSVLQETLDPVEDDLEYAEAAAESLPGQQVSLPGYLGLLGSAELLNIWHNLQGRVPAEQSR